MNGVHDVGGMHGFGRIRREASEPIFHAPWEGRVRAMMMTLIRRGVFNLDEMRRAIESIPPAEYLASSYYERWLAALRMLLVEKGVLTAKEITEMIRAVGHETQAPQRASGQGAPGSAAALLVAPAPAPVPLGAAASARFRPGDPVVARNRHIKGHTRLPRYIRGKRGVIDRVHGVYTFPDTHAHGLGENPQPVYSVWFSARALWGDTAAPGDSVYIDLWESYLDLV